MIDAAFVKSTLAVIGLILLVGIWGLCEMFCWLKYKKR